MCSENVHINFFGFFDENTTIAEIREIFQKEQLLGKIIATGISDSNIEVKRTVLLASAAFLTGIDVRLRRDNGKEKRQGYDIAETFGYKANTAAWAQGVFGGIWGSKYDDYNKLDQYGERIKPILTLFEDISSNRSTLTAGDVYQKIASHEFWNGTYVGCKDGKVYDLEIARKNLLSFMKNPEEYQEIKQVWEKIRLRIFDIKKGALPMSSENVHINFLGFFNENMTIAEIREIFQKEQLLGKIIANDFSDIDIKVKRTVLLASAAFLTGIDVRLRRDNGKEKRQGYDIAESFGYHTNPAAWVQAVFGGIWGSKYDDYNKLDQYSERIEPILKLFEDISSNRSTLTAGDVYQKIASHEFWNDTYVGCKDGRIYDLEIARKNLLSFMKNPEEYQEIHQVWEKNTAQNI